MTRHTKRLAAIASLIVGLLGTLIAVPTAAMASTTGPGPGFGMGPGPGNGFGPGPVPISILCPPLNGRPIQVKAFRRFHRNHHRRPILISINCARAISVSVPVVRACKPRPLVFDTTANSSALTEVSGPTLVPTDEFSYQGNIYTIVSINPGADSFTTFLNNALFVAGSSLTNQKATLLCAPRPGH